MNVNDFFATALSGNVSFLTMTIADMTDAELMMRPVPNANHANWQIGHLIGTEAQLVGMAGGKMPELPAGFAERYKKETGKSDDASKFATKAELLATFERVRAATIAWAKTLTPAQLAAKGPIDFTPTVADLLNLASGHLMMHLGQIQVLRRKLGKPILF